MATGQRTIGVATGPRIAPAGVSPAGPVDQAGTQTATAVAAGGVATIEFHPEPVGSHVELERVVVTSDSSAATEARVYVGAVSAANLRDVTNGGNEDVALEQPPIFVPGGVPIVVQWTGASNGAECTATIQYRLRG